MVPHGHRSGRLAAMMARSGARAVWDLRRLRDDEDGRAHVVGRREGRWQKPDGQESRSLGARTCSVFERVGIGARMAQELFGLLAQ